MATLEIKLDLPESLAREAEASGILTSEAIESLIREEIRRRRVEGFFAAARRLDASSPGPMTESEVEEEIAAARRQRNAPDARGA